MHKITPFLWFSDNAEEAMNFYCSIFTDSKIGNVNRGPDGKVFTLDFTLRGQDFMALNGGPLFTFNESVSFFVNCKDQAEVDELWDKLTADGGAESRCGWLKDKFGLSWQIVPDALNKTVGGSDPAGAQRAMQAMMSMNKLIVADLEKAYRGE